MSLWDAELKWWSHRGCRFTLRSGGDSLSPSPLLAVSAFPPLLLTTAGLSPLSPRIPPLLLDPIPSLPPHFLAFCPRFPSCLLPSMSLMETETLSPNTAFIESKGSTPIS